MHYLEPSKAHATHYLQERSLSAWEHEILLMIEWHHKLSAYTGEHANLVEAFRRADLVDVSIGLQANGLPKNFIREVKKAFPNRGFHWTLTKGLTAYMITHPLNPLPMMRK